MKNLKHLSMILLALLFGSVVTIFAAEIDFGGSVETGVRTSFDKDNGDNIILYSDEYDEDGVGIATLFNLSVTDEKWGVEVELGAENTDFLLSYAYGWLNLFDDILKVKAGLIDDDTWTTHGDAEYDFFSVSGVQLIVSPLEGLSFGIGATIEATDFDSASTEGIADLKDFSEGIAFGAAYVSDLLSAQVGYLLDGSAYIGLDVVPVENFTFTIEVGFENLKENDLIVILDELITWDITDSFAAELLCYQIIDTAKDVDTELTFEPAISYQLTDVVGLGLGFGYSICGDENAFYVKPGVEFALAEDVSLNLFYKYNSAEAEDDNVIQLDFIWNF